MGYINTKGTEVIKPQYSFALPFSYNTMVGDTIAKVEWKKKRGFIFKNDKSVYQFKFDDVNTPAEGMMAAKQKGKWGFVDKAQKNIIPFKFDNAGSFKNGMALASAKGKTGVIDRNGKWVVEAKYDEVFDSYVENAFLVRQDEKYGIVGKTGNEILPVQYNEPENITGDIYLLTVGDKIAYYNMVTRRFIWQQQ
ncbi:MAG: WG repeat-containing protein [Sphingobacteriales bacterium JAD_PAG50586_3]|nr:MAG: WG repeat-containing protein [Sphingobacteriales bacterium JAD_PAG50586_3]